MKIGKIYIIVSLVVLVSLAAVIGNFIKNQASVNSVIEQVAAPGETEIAPTQNAPVAQPEGVAPVEDEQGLPVEIESNTDVSSNFDSTEELPVEAESTTDAQDESPEELPIEGNL